MATNEAYKGEYYYGKTRTVRGPNGSAVNVDVPKAEWIRIEGFTPVVVPPDLWERVQTKL